MKIKEAVIVEGKYDKIKLSGFLDTLIIETEGFSIFKNKEKQDFIRKLAQKRGILILTDSDRAGFQIRSYLGGMIPPKQIKHAYIPDIFGKEDRKTETSKEGKLGVEGMSKEILLEALKKAGVLVQKGQEKSRQITNADLYEWGFSGRENARDRRMMLLESFGLPARLSSGALLKTLNTFISYEDFIETAEKLSQNKDEL